ncbi:MAG: DUF423 domain-containing protein [Pseudomonadota bacterium]
MNKIAVITAMLGFLAVLLGAFGAHGLQDVLSVDDLDIWQTANQYHFYHVLALLVVIILWQRAPQNRLWFWTGLCFIFGIAIFSGSLYLLAVTGLRWLGAITPVGGTLFLVAWLLLAYGCLRLKPDESMR